MSSMQREDTNEHADERTAPSRGVDEFALTINLIVEFAGKRKGPGDDSVNPALNMLHAASISSPLLGNEPMSWSIIESI